ncbi:MAG TPA: hypothetical protein VD969_28675 [Symbiobacteriaceae bacterium]|nr:hypothetical protein [Symbiobacteriaceae bacterium]
MCADFAVLRYPQLPCMLLESHFGTDPADDAAADRAEFIPTLSDAIARGLAAALGLPGKSSRLMCQVILPLRPGEASPRTVTGEIRDGVTYAILPGTDFEQAVRPVGEAMGRAVRYLPDPPTVIIE